MVGKKREDALATREHLLDAAVELFESRGVSSVSLNDIACQAGVTRGAIYWHFKNKEDLFVAMIERLVCPLLFLSDERAQMMADDPVGFIRKLSGDFFDRMEHDTNFFRTFEILWHKCEYVGKLAEIRQSYLVEGADHIEILQKAFSLAQQRAQINTCLSPKQAAIGLVSLIDGLIFNWTKKREMLAPTNDGALIIDIFLQGLGWQRPRETTDVETGKIGEKPEKRRKKEEKDALCVAV